MEQTPRRHRMPVYERYFQYAKCIKTHSILFVNFHLLFIGQTKNLHLDKPRKKMCISLTWYRRTLLKKCRRAAQLETFDTSDPERWMAN